MRIVQAIINKGVSEGDDLLLQRKKEVFNVFNIFGSITAIPQFFMLFPFDRLSAYSFGAWGIIAFASFLLHGKLKFKTVRNISLFAVLLLGGIGAMRTGPELYPHFASLGIFFAGFLFFDIKEEWRIVLVFSITELVIVLFTELAFFQVTVVEVDNVKLHRSFIIIGTILFLILELYLFKDIITRSELKANLELQKRNNEKDILLKEIHHRVKNNLQLLVSLIRLRTHKFSDPNWKNELDEINNRIFSIARLHDKVYLNESVQFIKVTPFLNEMIQELNTQILQDQKLSVNVDTDLSEIDLANMVPLTLILNELITNSFKHAAKSVDHIELNIIIKVLDESNKYCLTYMDNGQWINNPSIDESTGLSLINALAEQLYGGLEIIENESRTNKKSLVYFKLNVL